MSKLTRIIVLLSLAILAASAVSLFGAAKSEADFMGNLNGNVGPNAVISLSTPEGALVSSLGPGTYAIHVTDVATNHNFHLEGAGVNLATSIDATETADWTVDFLDAYYTYRCDRHANLNGSFTSGNPAALVAPRTDACAGAGLHAGSRPPSRPPRRRRRYQPRRQPARCCPSRRWGSQGRSRSYSAPRTC